ncbi:MAG: hypothetical protein ACOYOA_04620 [Saprospiraceae bacterium]
MDSQSFIKYLSDYSALKTVGFQDLQAWIEHYPYCQNLRFLICKKAMDEQNEDQLKYLNLAATYSTDRSYLYKLIHQNEDHLRAENANRSIEQEKLAVHTVEDFPIAVPIQRESMEEGMISKTLADFKHMQSAVADAEHIDEEEDVHVNFSSGLLHSNDYMSDQDNLHQPDQEIQDKTEEVSKNGPLPKSRFRTYSGNSGGSAIGKLIWTDESEIEKHRFLAEAKLSKEEFKRQEKQVERKKTEELVNYAESSLREKQDNATETLASLLALQGHKEKAIAMYEKLKLQIPEKSTYFGAQIEKIKIS